MVTAHRWRSMPTRPVAALDSPPVQMPSPPSSPRRGEVTPEFALPSLAACPVWLQAPSSQPQAEDAVFPCCAAFTHLSCLVQCARRHGSCPNCRVAVDHLPREPSIASRCRQLGIDLEPEAPPPHDTAFATVRDYSTRTFSRADAPEPAEPPHIRAVCCRRLAGPAMDFVELPDARMHWAPVPQRQTDGIGAWQALWICMRCQSELRLDRIIVPEPRAACPPCEVPLHWEVDMSLRQERWVCGRCPFAHLPRPLALGLACMHLWLTLARHHCHSVTGLTRVFTFLSCSTQPASFRPMRSARGGHMPPSASGGLPQSRPCLPAPLYPCARFAQQWNMFPKPFHRRRSSPAHLSASGHGPRLESHRSRHSQRSSAPSPRRMKATTSRPLRRPSACKRACCHIAAWASSP